MNSIDPKCTYLDNPVFDSLAASSDDVYLYVTDLSTNEAHWSRSCVEYFDLPSEYMTSPEKIWVNKIHPDDRKVFLDDIEKVISGRSDRHCVQYRALNRYGYYVWLECSGTVAHDEDGNAILFGGIMKRIDKYTKYDPLTKLLTVSELELHSFQGKQGSMLLLGLDHFRAVISNYGLNFANRVLVSVANSLQQFCSGEDCIYRFGGQEFLIDLPGRNSEYAGNLFGRIAAYLEQIRHFGEHSLNISVSGGVVSYPQHSDQKEELISYLENCLQHAKAHCRGKAVLYTKSLSNRHMELMELKTALSASIQNGFEGFELYYQPVINLRTGCRIMCEALLRWKHNGTIVSPVKFIPLLEESGEIVRVGDWVMEEAFRTLNEWEEKDILHHIGFNTSPVQYMDTGFADRLVEMGKKMGINPSGVTVELTESYGVENTEALRNSVNHMRKAGYRVSMDDFGIEHSTMSLLTKIQVDSIKIDHTFVLGLRNEESEVEYALIQALVDMSHRIGLQVVGEGVEDEGLRSKLINMGVDMLQGYLYSKPIPKKEFEAVAMELKKRMEDSRN